MAQAETNRRPGLPEAASFANPSRNENYVISIGKLIAATFAIVNKNENRIAILSWTEECNSPGLLPINSDPIDAKKLQCFCGVVLVSLVFLGHTADYI